VKGWRTEAEAFVCLLSKKETNKRNKKKGNGEEEVENSKATYPVAWRRH